MTCQLPLSAGLLAERLGGQTTSCDRHTRRTMNFQSSVPPIRLEACYQALLGTGNYQQHGTPVQASHSRRPILTRVVESP